MPIAAAKRIRRPAPKQPTILVREDVYNPSPLQVDEDKGIIFGVRVLGNFSPNTHGVPGVTEGTEYTDDCRRDALKMIEGASVKTDHLPRNVRDQNRSVYESFGVLRNARIDGDCARADLHYFKNHELAPLVVEDVKRGLGQFGLSINGKTVDAEVRNGRYVVNRLAELRSVDLVDSPATNRNLWESRERKPMSQTFKQILESQLPKLSVPRQAWLKAILEDDAMAPAMAAPVDEPPADPDQALADGFEAAILAVVQDDSMDASAKAKKIAQLLKTHEKLTQQAEPTAPAADAAAQEDDAKDEKDKPKMESRLRELETKDACRDLCETLDFVPTKQQLADLTLIDNADARKRVAESFKSAKGAGKIEDKPPKSRAFGKTVAESAQGGTRRESGLTIQEMFARCMN